MKHADWNDHDGLKIAVAREGAEMMLLAWRGEWGKLFEKDPFMAKLLGVDGDSNTV